MKSFHERARPTITVLLHPLGTREPFYYNETARAISTISTSGRKWVGQREVAVESKNDVYWGGKWCRAELSRLLKVMIELRKRVDVLPAGHVFHTILEPASVCGSDKQPYIAVPMRE